MLLPSTQTVASASFHSEYRIYYFFKVVSVSGICIALVTTITNTETIYSQLLKCRHAALCKERSPFYAQRKV